MENSTTVTGQILALADAGYTEREIYLELKGRQGMGHLSAARVHQVLEQVANRTLDSRRLFEIWESQVEILALLRELVGEKRAREAVKRMRSIERRGLMIDPTVPAPPGSAV